MGGSGEPLELHVQAARHRLRLSVADGPHRINFPVEVRPNAPRGLQNAPGRTPFCTEGAVVSTGVGLGFGFGAVVRGGLVVFRTVGVRVGFGAVLVVAVVGAAVSAVGLTLVSTPPAFRACTGAVTVDAEEVAAGAERGFESSPNAPTIPLPQQHRPRSPARVTPMVCLVVSRIVTWPSLLAAVRPVDGPFRRASVRKATAARSHLSTT